MIQKRLCRSRYDNEAAAILQQPTMIQLAVLHAACSQHDVVNTVSDCCSCAYSCHNCVAVALSNICNVFRMLQASTVMSASNATPRRPLYLMIVCCCCCCCCCRNASATLSGSSSVQCGRRHLEAAAETTGRRCGERGQACEAYDKSLHALIHAGAQQPLAYDDCCVVDG